MTPLHQAGPPGELGPSGRRTGATAADQAPGGDGELPEPHSALLPLHTAPGHLIRLAQQVHERIWQGRVGLGLTSVQYAVLLTLAHSPGMDQRSIGEAMSLDKSNIADVLLRLGRRGLLVRHRDLDDGRRRVVRLTEQGLATLVEASPSVIAVQQEVMAPLAPSARATCLNLLGRVAFRGRVPVPPSPDDPSDAIAGWPSDLPPVHVPTAPGHLIRRAQQVHTVLWGEHVDARLTSVQYVVLVVLDAHRDIDQRTLGDHASLDKSTGGDILARMAARGLVGRTRDLSDGRRNLLHLTRLGREELRRHAPSVVRVQRELLRPLSSAEHRQFTDLMRTVAYAPA